MSTVRLPDDLKQRLDSLSDETNRSKSFYIRMALEEYLEEHEEELKALAIRERIRNGKEKLYTLEEARSLLEKIDD